MKYNEILVKNILNKYIFNETLVGGDSQKYKLPDLYTEDKKLGIEVTACELDVDYYLRELKEECAKVNFNLNKCIQIRNRYEKKAIFAKLKERIGYNSNVENKHIFIIDKDGDKLKNIHINLDVINIGFVPYIFAKMYEIKLKKLHRGNYNGVNEKNLAVSSLLRVKNIESAKLCFYMYELSNSKNYNEYFNKTYLIFRQGIFIFGKDEIEDFIKMSDVEYQELFKKSKIEYENQRNKRIIIDSEIEK